MRLPPYLPRPAAFPWLVLGIALLAAAVLREASVMEDSYITFRVMDNAVHGYGLRWNLHERVQPYTNPLWLFLHMPFYALWDNIFLITLLLGLLCTGVAVALPLRTFGAPPWAAFALFLLPLALSRSFAVYATSGFENPLEHALFAWFGWILLKARPERFWLLLSLCTALAMVNRLDALIALAPVWLFLLATRFPRACWRQCLRQCFLGALPILAWEAFSLFYYGFPFPNTKYAKLNTGIPAEEYRELGLSYLLNLLAVDTVSALLIIASLAAIPFLALHYRATRQERSGLLLGVALGSLCHGIYVVLVGGTYLSGRLLSVQVLAAAWILLGLHGLGRIGRTRALGVAALLCAVKLAAPPLTWVQQACPACVRGVDPITGEVKFTLAEYLGGRLELPRPNTIFLPHAVHLEWSMGRWGFAVDRQVKIVDGFALVDPLLARLPIAAPHIVTMGMTPRAVPAGYMDALATGRTDGMDPDLARYYDRLRLIISGELWSLERLAEIVTFNAGAHDALRDAYVQRQKKQ